MPEPLRPAPPPLEVDTFTVVLIGMGLWVLAFLALLPFRDGHGVWLQSCAVGFGLGFLGLLMTRNRRHRRTGTQVRWGPAES
ncbi:MAG TPA: DUF2530 domain-containing protein [Mycobacteriales bacterium]|nr:DUF2530 domain-containing protein [Mycobacteriales bacterium]